MQIGADALGRQIETIIINQLIMNRNISRFAFRRPVVTSYWSFLLSSLWFL
jgi:hypothetical protein